MRDSSLMRISAAAQTAEEPSTSSEPGSSAAMPGRMITSAPAKPAMSATIRRTAHRLAEQEHRAHGDEERRREAQSGNGAEGRDRHRQEKHQHGRDVDRAPYGMERQLARAERPEAVAQQERRDEDEAEEIAEEGDFEGVLLARCDADYGVHRREADGGPQQQQHAARRRRQGKVGGEQRRERPGPARGDC